MSSPDFPIGTNGRRIPAIGFGTFQPENNSGPIITEAVVEALQTGYRHIDTAWMYGEGESERAVGEALRQWGGNREDVFIVTKLANAHHTPEDVEAACELSLKNLGVDYIDLYLMHTPVAYKRIGTGPDEWKTVRYPDGKPVIDYQATKQYPATWAAMENLVAKGKVLEIGVSNFSIKKLSKLSHTAKIMPAVNQVELHPYLLQLGLLQYCERHNIHVTAFSPLGGKPVAAVASNANIPGPLQNPILNDFSQTRGMSPAQALLKWGIQRGTSVIPKAYDSDHLRTNYAIIHQADFTATDMDVMNGIYDELRPVRYINAAKHWGFDIFDPNEPDPSEQD